MSDAESEKVEFTVHEMIALLPKQTQRTIEQMAIFENSVDHLESGTPEWKDMPQEGRDLYLIETHRRILMLITMGWRFAGFDNLDDYIPADMPAPEDMDPNS